MALHIHPSPGTIVICDFTRAFVPPEMVKRRPAIVVSPRFRERESLCTVVPMSTTAPDPQMPYHYKLELNDPLPAPYNSTVQWVKADMVVTVSLHRLMMPYLGKDDEGKRIYDTRILSAKDFAAIQNCTRAALGL
ncbi:type II toxin-antitoxin system PemK/MazF family toxin [Sneathiella sp.]|uniref:type II toxin-antitoxin system PemK/MazF family toxin n=1 Tax=Sneathiella sp. TaxID=1964365 RepID=UPI00345DCD8B